METTENQEPEKLIIERLKYDSIFGIVAQFKGEEAKSIFDESHWAEINRVIEAAPGLMKEREKELAAAEAIKTDVK